MALSDAAVGAQDAIQQIIRKRMQEQQLAAQLQQQQFENQRQLAGDQRADTQLGMQAQQHDAAMTGQNFQLGDKLAEQIPANTFLPENEPAVNVLQNTGRGALLTKTDPFKALGPDFAGPQQDPTITPEIAAVGRPGGFLKTATASQQNTLADNERAAATEAGRARSAEQTAKDREMDNNRQAERDKEIARHNAEMERLTAAKPGTDPEVTGMRKDLLGLQVQAERDRITKGETPKEPTQPQYLAGGFAGRLEQAESTLGPLSKDIAGMNVLSFSAQSHLPPIGQSGQFQSYDQAARNFVNAVLRRESGAAISPAEFDNARRQYLPQPGDTPQTLAQKANNRQYVTETMKRSAGAGYQAPVELPSSGGRTAPPASTGTVTIKSIRQVP